MTKTVVVMMGRLMLDNVRYAHFKKNRICTVTRGLVSSTALSKAQLST